MYPPPIHQPPPSFVKRRMPAPYLYTPFPHCYQECPAIWLTILVPNFQPSPLLPPRKKNTLPSFLLQKKTIPLYLPSLLYAAAVVMETKTHDTLSCAKEREREKLTLPLLWRHPVAPPRMSTPQQCSNMSYINWNMRRVVAAAFLQSQTNPHTIQSTLHTNHRQRILVISQSL